MTRYIAFLRAINVGGHVVKMDQLRRIVAESIGAGKVDTFIASGNVMFESSARNARTLEKKIAGQLEKALGYEVATFIRTAEELREVAAYKPFPDSSKNAADPLLYIGFLADALLPAEKRMVASFKSDVDDFLVHQREIYWQCRIRSSESEFSLARLEKALGVQATFRNSTTVRKIAARYGSADC